MSNLKQGRGSFVPRKVGMHEIVVSYEEQEVIGGHYFRVLPELVEVAPPGMAPCALGSLVQVLVNATGIFGNFYKELLKYFRYSVIRRS